MGRISFENRQHRNGLNDKANIDDRRFMFIMEKSLDHECSIQFSTRSYISQL